MPGDFFGKCASSALADPASRSAGATARLEQSQKSLRNIKKTVKIKVGILSLKTKKMQDTFDQNARFWRALKIPGTNYTLGKDGCAICSLASLARFYGHEEADPINMTQRLTFQGGLVLWGSMTAIYPDIHFMGRITNPIRMIIWNELDAGRPVIAQINGLDNKQKFAQHWVVIWQKTGMDDYIISDSVKNKRGSFKEMYTHDQKIYAAATFRQRITRHAGQACKLCFN